MTIWFTTKVLGDDNRIYDLGKLQLLPPDVMAVNAWTEIINEKEKKNVSSTKVG